MGGASLWTGADDGLVKKWDLNTGACVAEFAQQSVSGFGASVWCVHAGLQAALVSGSTDGTVRVFDDR